MVEANVNWAEFGVALALTLLVVAPVFITLLVLAIQFIRELGLFRIIFAPWLLASHVMGILMDDLMENRGDET